MQQPSLDVLLIQQAVPEVVKLPGWQHPLTVDGHRILRLVVIHGTLFVELIHMYVQMDLRAQHFVAVVGPAGSQALCI